MCDDGEDLDQSVESLQQSINNLQRWVLVDDNMLYSEIVILTSNSKPLF